MSKTRKDNKTVSIVVPVYNAGNYLRTTIDAVIEQTYSDWELLLVDDCSTDNSIKMMQEYNHPQIKLIQQPQNLGAAKARNRGLEEASGRYIAFLDADDIWKRDKLEKELLFMKRKEAAFVFTSYEYADENGNGNGKTARVPHTLTYREALKNTIIFTSTVLLDSSKISKKLLEMPEVKSEDTATWWKILKSGYTAYGLDEILVLYRRPAKSLSSNKLEAIRRIWNLYRKTEGLSLIMSFYNFTFYAVRTTLRRL